MNDDRQEEGGSPFHILFVCTGNTCRSPMAEGLARAALAARGWNHVRVGSAGVAAFPDAPISGGALRAAGRHGISLDDHRATPLSAGVLGEADLILTMSPAHLGALEEAGVGHKSALLPTFARGDTEIRPGDRVPDPIGAEDAVYERTFEALKALVEAALDRLAPILTGR